MFGFGKKEVNKKKSLLELENIRLNCTRMSKEEVIRKVGNMLCGSGYVEESYTESMLQREITFPTNIGNGIALPHGVEEGKKAVKSSGIVVLVFPEGTNWGTEDVKLVIGIAGAGEEHLEILSIIAEKMSDPDAVERMMTCSAEEIYRIFTEKGEAA